MRQGKNRGKKGDEGIDELIKWIIDQAKRTGKEDSKRMAKQIMVEAKIVARWKEKPFYIA